MFSKISFFISLLRALIPNSDSNLCVWNHYIPSPYLFKPSALSHFLISFCPISLGHYRTAVTPALLVACPWRGYDPALSPTGPTSTPQPLAPPPPPPLRHIARLSVVPPPTTGSDDTVTSVSLFSKLFLSCDEIWNHELPPCPVTTNCHWVSADMTRKVF